MKFYDFKVIDFQGEEVGLDSYKGKVVLIVNTATGCGFTPQYEGLQKIYDELNGKGFEILDFPCNQFANQAPGNDKEIHEFCTFKYHTTFKQFKKIDVNGKNESPLYTFLKSEKKGCLGSRIKWNFTKFLVDKSGNVVKRFGPTVKPEKIRKYIVKYLDNE